MSKRIKLFLRESQKKNINSDFKYIFVKFISLPLKITGFDVFVADYRLHWISYLMFFDIFLYVLVNGYSIYLFSEDLKSTCYCMVTYGYAIVGAYRIYIGLVHGDTGKYFRDQILSYKFDEKTEIKEKNLYLWYGRVTRLIGSLSMVILIFALIVLTIAPFLIWIITGHKQLTFGFVLPWLNYECGIGFALNYVFQIYQGLTVISGFAGFLHLQLVLTAFACFQIDLMVVKLEKLDITVQTESSKKKDILKILKLHQNLNDFLSKMEDAYSLEAFFSTFFLSLNMVVTLFVCVQEFWIIGILITITVTYTVLIVDLFGVAIEMKATKLERFIFGIPWYNLTVCDQKLILQFLHGAQNGIKLTYAGMFLINLESFTQIYKSIYSYLMFLIDIQA